MIDTPAEFLNNSISDLLVDHYTIGISLTIYNSKFSLEIEIGNSS